MRKKILIILFIMICANLNSLDFKKYKVKNISEINTDTDTNHVICILTSSDLFRLVEEKKIKYKLYEDIYSLASDKMIFISDNDYEMYIFHHKNSPGFDILCNTMESFNTCMTDIEEKLGFTITYFIDKDANELYEPIKNNLW